MELMRLESVASIIQNKLNEISEIMFEQEQIEEETFFVINDNFQKVDERIKKGGKDYVKGTLRSVNSRMPDDSFAGVLFEEYVINFTYTYTKKDILEKILNQYSINEGINPVDKIDGLTISKAVQKARWMGKETIGNDENREKGKYQLFVAWTITIGGITGKETSIEIDGEKVDILKVDYINNKALIPNKSFGINNNDAMVSESIEINFPIQSISSKNQEILQDITTNSYNKKYNIKLKIGMFIKEIEVMSRTGRILFTNSNNAISFVVMFHKVRPRVVIEIDNEVVEFANFGLDNSKGIETIGETTTDNILSRSIANQSAFVMGGNMIIDENNTKSVEILNDVLNGTINKVYQLKLVIKGVESIKNVILQVNKINLTESDAEVIECTFIEDIKYGNEI